MSECYSLKYLTYNCPVTEHEVMFLSVSCLRQVPHLTPLLTKYSAEPGNTIQALLRWSKFGLIRLWGCTYFSLPSIAPSPSMSPYVPCIKSFKC